MDFEKIYKLRKYAYNLSKGIDPTSGIEFKEDTIMNIPSIRLYNAEVCKLLDSMLTFKGKDSTKKRIPFFVLQEDIEHFQFSTTPISISELCFHINELSYPGMEKLRATQLTAGLVKGGILREEKNDQGKDSKVPTEKGLEYGIRRVSMKNSYGADYEVNLYDVNAQKYILENIQNII